MNSFKQSLYASRHRLLVVAVLCAATMLGVIDPAAAAMGLLIVGDVEPTDLKAMHKAMETAFAKLGDGIKVAQDTATKAIEEVRQEGTLHKATSDKLTEISAANLAAQAEVKSIKDRLLEIEQKAAQKPGSEADDKQHKTAGELFAESQEYKDIIARRQFNSAPVMIERKAIVNASGQNQPLVPAQRVPGIIMPPQRRLTVRDLLPQIPTSSNLIEFARELVYTNAAAPQGGADSPTGTTEGAVKPESNITFELATSAVITLAHWIGASRQVLSDAAQLAGYINSRLEYGLKLEEESELLNSDGTAGELNGLVNQATAFTGGATNQTALDTLLKAFLQVSLSEYEATGVVLHPTDWTNIMLLKDTTGRYLFSDPHSTEAPRVWGKNVVATQSMVSGTFLTGAFDLGAAIYDNEGVSIRVSDQHNDFFTRNLVAILCEERLALAMYRPAAFVSGDLSYAG